MDIFITLLIGLLVGGTARLLMPERVPGGVTATLLLGMAGAVIAGAVGKALGYYGARAAPGVVISILGAFVVLGIYRAVISRRAG